MKTQKILTALNIICLLLISNNLNAKFGMVSLDRIKNKVSNALDQAEKQTEDSFKKLLGKKNKNSSKQKENLKALANAITTLGNSSITGLQVFNYMLEEKLETVDEFFSKITWGNQPEFIEKLNLETKKSKDKGRQLLHNKITKKYPTTKSPLINCATDIHNETEKVAGYLKDLAEFMEKNKNNINDNDLIIKQQETLEKLFVIQNNLEQLSKIINNLLI